MNRNDKISELYKLIREIGYISIIRDLELKTITIVINDKDK